MDDKTKKVSIKADPKNETTRVRGLKYSDVLVPSAGGVAAVALFSSFSSGPSPVPGVELTPVSENAGEIPQAAATAAAAATAQENTDQHTESATHTTNHELVVPSHVLVNNNFDDLSFEEALERARLAAGPGKIFIYQGVPVLTTTSEDFNAMTTEQQQQLTSQIDMHPATGNADDDDIFSQTGSDDSDDVAMTSGGNTAAGTIESINDDNTGDDTADNTTAATDNTSANTTDNSEAIDVTEITQDSAAGSGNVAVNSDSDDIWSNTGAEDSDVALDSSVAANAANSSTDGAESIWESTGGEDSGADTAMNGGSIETIEIDDNAVAMNDNRDEDGAIEISEDDLNTDGAEEIELSDDDLDPSMEVSDDVNIEDVTLEDDEDVIIPQDDTDDENNR